MPALPITRTSRVCRAPFGRTPRAGHTSPQSHSPSGGDVAWRTSLTLFGDPVLRGYRRGNLRRREWAIPRGARLYPLHCRSCFSKRRLRTRSDSDSVRVRRLHLRFHGCCFRVPVTSLEYSPKRIHHTALGPTTRRRRNCLMPSINLTLPMCISPCCGPWKESGRTAVNVVVMGID